MFVKVCQGLDFSETHPCDHIAVRNQKDGSTDVELYNRVGGDRPPRGPVFAVGPEDNDVIYIMNDKGDTIDTIRATKGSSSSADTAGR